MPAAELAYIRPAGVTGWRRWLLSPAGRIGFFVIVWITLMKAEGLLLNALGHVRGQGGTGLAIGIDLGSRALAPLLAYLLLVRGLEQREPDELAPRNLLPHGLTGLALGFALFSVVVGLMAALGIYHIDGAGTADYWPQALLVFGLGAGIGEEIVFRGVLFRIVEEGLGSIASLVISALFFGAVHLGNPGATLWSSAAIAIEAGLLFGLLYHVSRSLYLCMGLHAAWNVTQGFIWGIPVSGLDAHGLLLSHRTGPDWLSGGMFGAEASVLAMACCLLLSIALYRRARQQHSLLPPSWRRSVSIGATA